MLASAIIACIVLGRSVWFDSKREAGVMNFGGSTVELLSVGTGADVGVSNGEWSID